MKPRVVACTYGEPVYESSNPPHPAFHWKLRDRRSRLSYQRRPRIIPDYVSPFPQHLRCGRQPAQDVATAAPHVDYALEIVELLFHIPADVRSKHKLYWSVGR